MFAIPHGESLATFERYPDAQELVNTLVSKGVPARALSIVGSPVALVERITGKIGYGRAAVSAAISGSWLGLIAGLVFVVLSPTGWVRLVCIVVLRPTGWVRMDCIVVLRPTGWVRMDCSCFQGQLGGCEWIALLC